MGYGRPPWDFKGDAIYQLSLVKIEEVRDMIATFLNGTHHDKQLHFWGVPSQRSVFYHC